MIFQQNAGICLELLEKRLIRLLERAELVRAFARYGIRSYQNGLLSKMYFQRKTIHPIILLSITREGMPEELSVLKSVCHSLDQAAIPYMLTGSFAANLYATPRMTRDVDIVIAIQKPRIDKFLQFFQNDFYIDRMEIVEAIEAQGMFNILHNETVLKIDFIVLKNTPYRDAEFQRRRRVQLDDASIWVVAPEDLIISKLFWAKESLSAIQLGDVQKLLAGHVVLDREYIRHWINELGLQQVYEKANVDE